MVTDDIDCVYAAKAPDITLRPVALGEVIEGFVLDAVLTVTAPQSTTSV